MNFIFDVTEELIVNNTNEMTTQFIQRVKKYFDWMEREENWIGLRGIRKITLVVDGEEIIAQSHDDLLDLRIFIKKIDSCKHLHYLGVYTYNAAEGFDSISLGYPGFQHGGLFFKEMVTLCEDGLRETVIFKSIAIARIADSCYESEILSFGTEGLKENNELLSDDLAMLNFERDWFGPCFEFHILHKHGIDKNVVEEIKNRVSYFCDFENEELDVVELEDGQIEYSGGFFIGKRKMQEMISTVKEIDRLSRSVGSKFSLRCQFQPFQLIPGNFECIYLTVDEANGVVTKCAKF